MNNRYFLLQAVFLCLSALAWGVFSLELNHSTVFFGTGLNPDHSPFYQTPALTLKVQNSGDVNQWFLNVFALGDITSALQSTTIPIRQLSMRGGNLNPYMSVSITPSMQVDTGGIGTFNISMDYRLDVNWSNIAADDYSVNLCYTLTGE